MILAGVIALCQVFFHLVHMDFFIFLFVFLDFLMGLFDKIFQHLLFSKGAHPCTSSSGQGGGKRVLEDFF